jgi:hypothetical protein
MCVEPCKNVHKHAITTDIVCFQIQHDNKTE